MVFSVLGERGERTELEVRALAMATTIAPDDR